MSVFGLPFSGLADTLQGLAIADIKHLTPKFWDFHFDPQTSVVETHISRLRAKIDKPFDTPLLHTVRNTGYSLHAR